MRYSYSAKELKEIKTFCPEDKDPDLFLLDIIEKYDLILWQKENNERRAEDEKDRHYKILKLINDKSIEIHNSCNHFLKESHPPVLDFDGLTALTMGYTKCKICGKDNF